MFVNVCVYVIVHMCVCICACVSVYECVFMSVCGVWCLYRKKDRHAQKEKEKLKKRKEQKGATRENWDNGNGRERTEGLRIFELLLSWVDFTLSQALEFCFNIRKCKLQKNL